MMTSDHMSVKVGRFICDTVISTGLLCDGQRLDGRHQQHREEQLLLNDAALSCRLYASKSAHNFQFFYPDLLEDHKVQSLPRSCELEKIYSDQEDDDDGVERHGGDFFFQWMEDNSRTLLPNENDRVSRLLRVCQPNGETFDESSKFYEEDADFPNEGETEDASVPLPWRSQDETVAVEDEAKYQMTLDEFGGDATPKIFLLESLVMQAGGEMLANPLFSSFVQSSSPPSSSSLWNHPRHDLSNCRSLTQSHWLSEAESRHSEPFNCPQHHQLLPPATSASGAAGGVIERCHSSSVLLHHTNHNDLDHLTPSSFVDHEHALASSSTRVSQPSPPLCQEDEEIMTRHEQVLLWLMKNDLIEAVAQPDDEDNNDDDDEANGKLKPDCNNDYND